MLLFVCLFVVVFFCLTICVHLNEFPTVSKQLTSVSGIISAWCMVVTFYFPPVSYARTEQVEICVVMHFFLMVWISLVIDL